MGDADLIDVTQKVVDYLVDECDVDVNDAGKFSI